MDCGAGQVTPSTLPRLSDLLRNLSTGQVAATTFYLTGVTQPFELDHSNIGNVVLLEHQGLYINLSGQYLFTFSLCTLALTKNRRDKS